MWFGCWQDMDLSNWILRSAYGVILIPICRPKNQENKRSQAKGQEAQDPKKASASVCLKTGNTQYPRSKVARQEEFALIQERVSLFALCRPSTIWKRLVYFREGNFTQSISLTVKLISKHPKRNIYNNVWPNICAPQGLVQITRKTNHHTGQAGISKPIHTTGATHVHMSIDFYKVLAPFALSLIPIYHFPIYLMITRRKHIWHKKIKII